VAEIRWPNDQELYGLFHLAISATPSFENYYESIRVLTPLLRRPTWLNSCSGFYLNSVDFGLPRLTYFAADATAATAAVESMCAQTGLAQVKLAPPLKAVRFTDAYGGSEARFRRYLCTYTQIGIELLESDRVHAQRLFATYRWRTWIAGASGKPHFEGAFLRLSPSYQSLSPDARSDFWVDFDFAWCWNHMFVNMILASDWNVPRSQAATPPSDAELTAFLAGQGLGFDVPKGWEP
jgi:hypothetical protein